MIIKLYEKYTDLKDIKDIIFLRAIETEKEDVVNFFIKKGYNINTNKALISAMYSEDIFKILLKNGLNFNEIDIDWSVKDKLKKLDNQKILIDFGYAQIIYDTVGFNSALQYLPKYKETVEMYSNMDKYNL